MDITLGSISNPKIVYEIPVYILFTVLATFIVAILTQVLSHFFANRRDKKKEFMQKYQDLYSNTLAPLSNYMYIKTNPMKGHDVHEAVEENDLLEITLIKLKENIKHASPALLKVHERYFGHGYKSDGLGGGKERDKHALVYFLLEDMLRTSKWTGIFSRSDRQRLKQSKYYYGLSAITLHFFNMKFAELVLQMEYRGEARKKVKYRGLGKELLTLDHVKMKKQLLKHLSSANVNEDKVYRDIIEKLSYKRGTST
ncbi:hypothetical protein [Sediminibacillus albus]|uniref:Uncharacterized protein n=1 Tax=Sediminibacillus albus TaxID=407036 RepID=A0A1G8X6E9_9BACI|nr:hypothetical protein [Sediminibacillus albus]SDJ86192.1 hypothetical protein SAMN05216243_1194 [Sediminibacillus albus]